MTANMSPWDVQEEQFPVDGNTIDQFRFLLNYAVLAPSVHNSQPWRFTVDSERIRFYKDPKLNLVYADPEQRQLIISCGAALFFLRTALHRFGYQGEITLLPDPADMDLLAAISLGSRFSPDEEDLLMFQSLLHRHTSREPFDDHALPSVVFDTIKMSAEKEGAWLHSVSSAEERERMIELITEGDREEMADPRFRREMLTWIHSDGSHKKEGLTEKAFGMPGLFAYSGPLMVRTFDTGSLYAARERQLAVNAPLLAVMGSYEDSPLAWLKTGQALARMLLIATSMDVKSSFLNSPIEVAGLRPRVRQLVSVQGFPQLILRIGYGPAGAATPRISATEKTENGA